jgi:hypothetical protein
MSRCSSISGEDLSKQIIVVCRDLIIGVDVRIGPGIYAALLITTLTDHRPVPEREIATTLHRAQEDALHLKEDLIVILNLKTGEEVAVSDFRVSLMV